MPWFDFYKLWTYQFEKGPLEKLDNKNLTGAGVVVPDAMPDLRNDAYGDSRSQLQLHDSNDFIDLSTVSNRPQRYKEYERLRSIPEIENAMTVISDEACIHSTTKISTLFDGLKTIKWLKMKWDQNPSPFLVYCWDFQKEDYALGWAYDPRIIKIAKTVKVLLDDGNILQVTPDHRILKRDQTWIEAGDLKKGDELMPFYRLSPNKELNKLKVGQFPRIFTFDGWKHERQFIDEWKGEGEKYEIINKAVRTICSGVSVKKLRSVTKHPYESVKVWLEKEGYQPKELRWLSKMKDRRKVLAVFESEESEVYDLSVKEHENFCTENLVVHNCQKNDNGNVFNIYTDNDEIKKELEFLCFNRKMLNFNRKAWSIMKKLCIFGDSFQELITDQKEPKNGILKIQELPPDSMYKIVTTKGRIVEYQQSRDGPDYQALTRSSLKSATDEDLMQSNAIRFSVNQVVHMFLGEDRKTFFPYGQSLIEPARGPAHQLRLMEDAMMVYRLSRAPERRIFYIDTGQLPGAKAEGFVERMKDQFRKKKVSSNKGNGASGVEERWVAPAADEDYWVPIRPNSNTRIETLPGAVSLSEIDDALYFRNKLYTALQFPKNYLNSEDVGATRITLSSQDARFARMIERIQSSAEDGFLEICERHLEMRGFPSDSYEDLRIEMTPPSAWKELSEAEIVNNRINTITSLKGSMIMSDFDLLTKYMKFSEDEAKKLIARNKIQKLEDLKIQVIGQNPQLMGIGIPAADSNEPEMGAELGGPVANIGEEPPQENEEQSSSEEMPKTQSESLPELPDPKEEDIKKYNLEIEDYSNTIDSEDIDWSEEN